MNTQADAVRGRDPAALSGTPPGAYAHDGTGTQLGRLHYMDAARGMMMILGVLFHADLLYSPDNWQWMFADDDRRSIFYYMQEGIHAFRMPVFFLISGFFCPLVLDRYGADRFLASKLLRIGVPLLSAAIVINTLQGYLLHGQRHGFEGLGSYLASSAYWQTWTNGEWVWHLWFLINLLVYFLAAYFLARWGSRVRLPAAGSMPLRWTGMFLGSAMFVVLPFLNLAIDALAYLVPALQRRIPLGVISPHTLLQYVPYFVFGALCYRHRPLLQALMRPRPYLLVAWAIAFVAFLALPHEPAELPLLTLRFYLGYLLAWAGCALVLRLFQTLVPAPSPTMSFAADASYTVYLFHHGLVLAFGIALAPLDWSPYVKYLLVVTATLAVTYALHYAVITRVPVLELLFNGVRPSERRGRRPVSGRRA